MNRPTVFFPRPMICRSSSFAFVMAVVMVLTSCKSKAVTTEVYDSVYLQKLAAALIISQANLSVQESIEYTWYDSLRHSKMPSRKLIIKHLKDAQLNDSSHLQFNSESAQMRVGHHVVTKSPIVKPDPLQNIIAIFCSLVLLIIVIRLLKE